ncbi:zinc finger protein 658B-like [Sitodiplosis mosellana]|uniref:zinc finger protein 658B-like n=1 Tax=Sitodiplosis mosellana TaxID=263140 RepID=UPI002444CD9D|nr:zinc finger protein 658B-like [Sitodiplosis mosellana]
MKKHMRTHNKLFKCSVCSKAFADDTSLHNHSRIHVKELIFDCSKCGHRFIEEFEKNSHEQRCTNRRYECYVCKHKCIKKHELMRHMRSNQCSKRTRSFGCTKCETTFSYKTHLKLHLATAHVMRSKPKIKIVGNKPNCQRETNVDGEISSEKIDSVQNENASSPELNINRKKEAIAGAPKKAVIKKGEEHKCNSCSFTTLHKSKLTIHIRGHTGEKPFECKVCMKSFARRDYLNRHEKIHDSLKTIHHSKYHRKLNQELAKKSNRRLFECNECEYSTFEVTNFTRHIRTHSGEKLFKCSICSKEFAQNIHLRNHTRAHVKELPFACSKCGQRFIKDHEKNSHEQRCNSRRYECYVCKFKSFRKADLKCHMRSNQCSNRTRSFECTNCGKNFAYKTHLKRHLAIHAKPRLFRCSVCGMKFKSKLSLKGHKATHPKPNLLRCSKCWKPFTEADKRDTHEGRCNARLYQCFLCSANVVDLTCLRIHMRSQHTREKPFSCKFCKISYFSKSSLVFHMKLHHHLEIQAN